MPDPAPTAPAPTAPPPPTQPTPAPSAAPSPAAAPATPPSTPPAGVEPPPLTRDSLITMQDKDGNAVNVTMGELADSHRDRPDPELLKQVELQQRIQSGDPEAIQEYVNKFVPKPAETPGEPSELEQVRDEVKTLRDLVQNRIAPVVNQVRSASDLQIIQAAVQAQSEIAPLLQKHPNAGQLVQSRWEAYKLIAKQTGRDLESMPRDIQAQAMKHAIVEVETFLKGTLAVYGVQAGAPAAPPPGSNIVSVNDQVPGEQQPGVRKAVWADQLLDPTRPGTMAPAAPQPVQPLAPLSSQPVPPMPTGAAVGIQGETPVAGPMTSETFRQRLRARTEKV